MNACLVNKPRNRSYSCIAGFLLVCLLASAMVGTGLRQPVQLKPTERAMIRLEGRIYRFALTEDGKAFGWVSLGPDLGGVPLCQYSGDKERIRTLPGTKGMVVALAFTPDGKTLATGGSASADLRDKASREGVLKLWDAASGKERTVLKGHSSVVQSLRFFPEGKILASVAGIDRVRSELKLWDVITGNPMTTVSGSGERGLDLLELTPDGRTLAWGSQGIYSGWTWVPEIKLIDVATGTELATLKGHTEELKCMAFSPDSEMLASGGGLLPGPPAGDGKTQKLGRKALTERPGQLRLWDVTRRKERVSLQGHNGCVLSVAFSPDGKMLASGGAGVPMPAQDSLWYWSGEVKLWDLATGKERVALRGHPFPKGTVEYVTFSPDGTTLASAGGNAVKLWDTATGRELAEVRGDSSETYFWIGFQRNRMLLLSRHLHIADHALKIWDAPLVK